MVDGAYIEVLTPAQIRDAMARHLDPERISFVKAGDFAKAAQAAAPAPPK